MREIREILTQAFHLQNSGRGAEAQEIYEHLLGMVDEPDPNLLFAYGSALASQKYWGIGSYLIRDAIKNGFDGFAGAWSNLGMCYFMLGRDERAKRCYLEALSCDPNSIDALTNLSGYHVNRDTPKEAEEYARKALAIEPDKPHAHSHLALALLEQGRFDEAWQHFAWRWKTPERTHHQRPYKAPHWNGERVGKLAIHGEQGVGDEILFCSRLNAARGRVDAIVVECMDRLIPVFERSFPGIRFYPNHAALIETEGEPDAYCAMGDLFQFCGLPDGKPYLTKPPTLWHEGLRVGLAWRGGTPRTNKKERTSALKDWAPILSIPGIEFVSVQYARDASEEEAKQAGLTNLVNSRDVDEAAKAISSCDLVITVCQTAVHLAGAMGIPCWVLTPKKCAWRYSGTGSQSKFYDSVTLYRQGNDEKWPPVIERIANDLRRFRA